MPIYRCPSCLREVIVLEAYNEAPDRIVCPHCQTSFNPKTGHASDN
jgi:DNA-directed RNA polymerase subunit RPC12/RpoP